MSNVTNLQELDALADELLVKSEDLSKSEPEEEKEEQDKSEEVKPEEVAEPTEESTEKEEQEKAEPEEEKEEQDKSEPEEEKEEQEDKPSKEDMEKSLQAEFSSHQEINQGIEASAFLNAVVEVLSKSLSEVQYNVQENIENQVESNSVLAKSLKASLRINSALCEENKQLKAKLDSLEKSMKEGFETITASLEQFSSQPAGIRKSVASVKVNERDFGVSVQGHTQPTGFESLSKSQVIGVLESEMMQGNLLVTPSDIIGYESGAPLREELKQLIINKSK